MLAADKVVVIPLGGGDVTTQQFNAQHVWPGIVHSDGSKETMGLFTFTRNSTGNYTVTLNLDGFDDIP